MPLRRLLAAAVSEDEPQDGTTRLVQTDEMQTGPEQVRAIFAEEVAEAFVGEGMRHSCDAGKIDPDLFSRLKAGLDGRAEVLAKKARFQKRAVFDAGIDRFHFSKSLLVTAGIAVPVPAVKTGTLRRVF